MKLFSIFYSIIFLLLVQSCSIGQKTSENYYVLDLEKFEQTIELDSSSLLVDVRTPEEFEAGHIEGSINIDFKNPAFTENIKVLDKSKTLYIYCRSGNRSQQSSKIFLEYGFPKVNDLEGGYLNYQKAHSSPTIEK